MKKIFFAVLTLVTVGGISYAQTTPAKKASTNSVSSVSPANTTKNTAASTKTKTTTTKTNTKPATSSAASSPTVPASSIGKHKKHHTAKKKNK